MTALPQPRAVADLVPGADGTGRVAELHHAFHVFTQATATLEREYHVLHQHVDALRRELEEKNRALAASIERQRCLEAQALRQSRLAAMGEMAASLAHEVRNPLGSMELFVKLLLAETASAPRPAALAEQIARGIADLNHLVTNILDYTRLPEPNLAILAVDDTLEEALTLAAPQLGAAVEVVRSGVRGARVLADRGLLTRVLLNLFRNAGDAMGGAGRLTIEVATGVRYLRLRVGDSGPGVPSGKEETIFTPFFTTKERGTGLGLALARAAIAAHGGTLALARGGNAGATFVITLPMPAAAAAEEGRA
jgi:two-component system, sensor histidine kinase FlrB